MGGIGSGRRFQNRRGPNLEEVPQLDIRVLKRNGLFDLSTSNGSIKWTNLGLSECALEYTYKASTFSIYWAKSLLPNQQLDWQGIFKLR